ncbi:MAG TPA: glutamyl-tRNA reductase [Phycisphaerae bacterium]|nr:glutamyl-tRNA reductase [Phycisphaerae bacterium]
MESFIPHDEVNLLLVGMNHRTAPIALRESLAFDNDTALAAMNELSRSHPGWEFVILSTCNRVELYIAVHGPASPDQEAMTGLLGQLRSMNAADISNSVYHRRQQDAVEHLFSVTSSLDSLVLGETQILGQVKQAYQNACTAGTVGAVFHVLFQRALSAAKEVHDATDLGSGKISVGSVAIDLLRGVFDSFYDKTVLIVGAGGMAELMLEQMLPLKPGKLIVTNRTPEKSREMASRFGLIAEDFSNLRQLLVQADIVLTGTGASEPVITIDLLKPLLKLRQYRPLVMVDIAVPRDVEADVGKLNNVYLYNIDDLEQVAEGNRRQRGGKVEESRALLARHTREFMHWLSVRNTGPVVRALYQHCRQISDNEVEAMIAAHPELTEEQRLALRKLAHRLVGKILHAPVTQITGQDLPTHRMHLAGAVRELFNLMPKTDQPSGKSAESEKGSDI